MTYSWDRLGISRPEWRSLRTGEQATLNRAGYALTHTKQWYVFLGRCM